MADDEYPFNDDLLIKDKDQDTARKLYGPLAEALIFPELIQTFLHADRLANKAKKRVHRWGLRSVLMVMFALIFASASQLYEGEPWARAIVFLSGALGILGSLGGFGVFAGRSKADWLENRLVTETLRQFHYRILVENASAILTACDAFATDHHAFHAYHARREVLLHALEADVIERKAGQFDALMTRADQRAGPEIQPMPTVHDFAGPHGGTFLEAYNTLRLRRQRQFADYKLKDDRKLFSKFPTTQSNVLGWIGIGCVLLLLLLHVYSAAHTIFARSEVIWVHQGAIWIAIVALAFRAIEEGLKPRAEVERYQRYQAVTERLIDQYGAGDIAAKLATMRSMEHAAYDEMVLFLRSYHEARFVM